MKGSVEHLNPDQLPKNPGYSQVVAVTGAVKTVYVGGQNAVDASGTIVGKGDMKAQTEQVLRNVGMALAAGGAKLEHVIKWNVYIIQGQSPQPGFEAFRRAWGDRPNPPIVTVWLKSSWLTSGSIFMLISPPLSTVGVKARPTP